MTEPVKDMTEAEMIEELKTWDEAAWKRFKEKNYETINIQFEVTND
jgi:hypothetical protein